MADPQIAVLGILQPGLMEGEPPSEPFDQTAKGHGDWHELMTSDPAAALAFYTGQFEWSTGEAMDMGDMDAYQLFGHGGNDMGGIMGLM